MIEELIKLSIKGTLGLIAIYGFAPGFTLRCLVRLYPKGHPRRTELLAELYAMKRWVRPFWVAEQLETVLFEGLPAKVAQVKRRPKRARSGKRGNPLSYILSVILTVGGTGSALYQMLISGRGSLLTAILMMGIVTAGLLVNYLIRRRDLRRR